MGVIGNNPVLVLGILGAAIALVASFSEAVQKKQSRRMIAGLAVLGFITLVAQQMFTAQSDMQRAEAEKNRDKILNAISGKVEHTVSVIDEISHRFDQASLSDIGERLVTVDVSARHVQEFLEYGKGPISAWDDYVSWLSRSRQRGARTFLSFDVNSSKHYVARITLVYLLGDPETRSQFRPVVVAGALGNWFNQPFVDSALLRWKGVDYVLFYDGQTQRVVAYASALAFANELLQHLRIGDEALVEEALNRPQQNAAQALSDLFPSIKTSVVESTKVRSVVETMLERKWPECIAGGDDDHFIVALVNVVRAAGTSGEHPAAR